MIKYVIFYSIIFIIIEIVFNSILISENILILEYQDVFSTSRIESLLEFRERWLWLTYLIKLILKLISIFVVSLIIYLGLYLSNFQIRLLRVFQIVILAEFIFFVPIVFKILWFLLNPFSFDAFQNFNPLSLYSLFNPDLLQEWLSYPFKVLNLFEVAYWVLLAFLLARYLKKSIDSMLKIVLGYYVSFLFCWVVFVMFISLGNS
ncbi:hypothetical protein [Algoriphagus sp.]|uniref:hypothetical protein n=1 Tax=Algoriphagus sp. TaxID=1872435 RepID=UPI00391A577F